MTTKCTLWYLTGFWSKEKSYFFKMGGKWEISEIWNQAWNRTKMVEINYGFVRCDNGIIDMLGNTHLGMQTDIFIIKILFYLYENEVKVA